MSEQQSTENDAPVVRTTCGRTFEHDWHAYRSPRGTVICDGVLPTCPIPPAECGARIATRHPHISETCALPVLHDGDHSSVIPPGSSDAS